MDNNYIGRVLDKRYKVSQLLGETGLGLVYAGEDLSNDRRVAIKMLQASTWTEQESVKRFFREARAAVELRHRNIIQVFDVGLSDEGAPYIVQEYLEGESLADLLLRVGKLTPLPALGIIEPVLRAIGAMHGKGIIHRGIKPDNIYLVHQPGVPPSVKLIDFGLAKFIDGKEKSNLTMVGVTLGDFTYISPEQIRDSSTVDKRSDLYTIGTILYELLTGELPFNNLPSDKRLGAKLTDNPTPPRMLVRSIPDGLNALIMSTLSVKPADRPTDAGEMLKIIELQKGYRSRESKLVKCAQGAKHLTIAGAVMDRSALPAGVQDKNRTGRKNNAVSTPKRPGFVMSVRARIVLAVSAFCAVVAIGFIASNSEDEKKPTADKVIVTAEMPLPKDVKPTEVQIEVRGLPTGAKIYYDDAPIPVNPFRVALKEVIVSLKIEAEGYEDWATSVVPAEDQVVKVRMTKIEEASAHDQETAEDNEAASAGVAEYETRVQRPSQNDGASIEKKKSVKPAKPKDEDETGFKEIKKDLKFSNEFD